MIRVPTILSTNLISVKSSIFTCEDISSQQNIMMQRTANENAACLRRICKRSDQPKIERLVNNDARLILR